MKWVRLFALILAEVALCNSYYLITSPNAYEPHKTVKLGVQIFGDKPCKVRVDISSVQRNGRTKAINSTEERTFVPGRRGELQLEVPDFNPSGWFSIQGTVCGKKTESLKVYGGRMRTTNSVLIQTDKPIYKPGQKVLMRIVSMDYELKPYGYMVSEVTIEDTNGTRVMQWNDVKLQEGIASLELQLSKQPVIGTWKIGAKVDRENASQEFEVKKYVLPKFEVTIKPPSYMALDQSQYTTTICAKYTYGKWVEGQLTAELCLTHGSSYGSTNSNCNIITKELKDGCSDIILTRNQLKIGEVTRLETARFQIDASVTEKHTGVTLKSSKSAIKGLSVRSFKLNFTGTPGKFKPGLPFVYQLKVTTWDGKPATGIDIRVTIRRGYGARSTFYNKAFKVKNGLIKEILPKIPHEAKVLHFRAELLTQSAFPLKLKSYDNAVQAVFTTKAWYSPSLSYLQISKSSAEPAKVGSHASLKVAYTVRKDTGSNTDFYYNVYCKGNLVASGVETQYHPFLDAVSHRKTAKNGTSSTVPITLPKGGEPLIEEFMIRFAVTYEMVTSCRVLVYYVRNDRETVADSLVYDVEDVFENKVSVAFSEDEKKPGENTKLVLKAHPGSRVSIVAVDKSVHLLRAGNEITRDKVLPLLNRLDPGRASNQNKKCPKRRRRFIIIMRRRSRRLRCRRRRSRRLRCRRRRYSDTPPRSRRPDLRGYTDDASEAFKGAGVVFLSDLNIFTKPCPFVPPLMRSSMRSRRRFWSGSRRASAHWSQRVKFARYHARPDYAVQDNDNGGDDDDDDDDDFVDDEKSKLKAESKKDTSEKAVRVRKNFPETWLWTDEKISDKGVKTIEIKVPDTITTWVANGFGMSSAVGFGVSDTTEIKAFQPFFVQVTLPYSVIRGEEVPVVITVFNYLPRCMPIKLELDKNSAGYKVTSYNIHKMCVCGDTGESYKFTIIPTKLGHIDITAEARPSSATIANCPSPVRLPLHRDKVIKKLLVEPEGITQEYTKSTFLCPKGAQKVEVFDLGLPGNIVPGSVHPTVSVIGDVMGPAMTNLDGLLRLPTGCGEQNMANFAPNIYVMDYLTKTAQVTEEIKAKAAGFMSTGYQRELTYKRKSGSYSAFGNSDKQGSLMLTAFVVRSFARAKSYTFIDDEQVKDSLKWLKGKQLPSGCFRSYGKLYDKNLQGGVNSELTITAYVIIALLESGMKSSDPVVSGALSCIAKMCNSTTDTYAIALSTYSLVLASHSKASLMLKLLREKAVIEGDQKHWSRNNLPAQPGPYRWYYRPPTADVEMTGYALLAILKYNADRNMKKHSEPLQIVKWLSQQRNSFGGFTSTQDTCVALQALSEFAGAFFVPGSSSVALSLKIKDFTHNFTITEKNRLVLQSLELQPDLIPNNITVTGKGNGCALVQASVKYNIAKPEEVPAFDVQVRVRRRTLSSDEEKTLCDPLKLEITAKWLKPDVSNMAVIDVKLPSGFSARPTSLENLLIDLKLKCKRFDIEGKHVQLYFDEIKKVTFSIDIHQDELVKKLKPSVVRVYDYYEPDQEGTNMYELTERMCYGNKVAKMCPRCLQLPNARDVTRRVNCSNTVRLIKSEVGQIKVVQSFTDKIRNQAFDYSIADICFCEGISDNSKAVMIGVNNLEGNANMMKLDGRTTIIKLKPGTVKKVERDVIRKCQRQ